MEFIRISMGKNRVFFNRLCRRIVVLSGGRHIPPGDSKIIEWSDPDRFISGIDLFRANKSSKLIFTGGSSPFYLIYPQRGIFT